LACGGPPLMSAPPSAAGTADAKSPPPSTSAPGPATPREVTAAQNETTLHLSVGERFELALGSGQTWKVTVENPSVVAPVVGTTLPAGVQGIFEAKAAGTTVVSALGRASCAPGSMCPQYVIAFTITVVVG
jgi:hypothetical protein